MSKLTFLILLLLLVSGCSQNPVDIPTASNSMTAPPIALQQSAQQSGTVQILIPVDTTLVNDCAGEVVDLVGTDHLIAHQTINGNNINLNFTENFQSVIGTGETTGDTYTTSSVLHNHITAHKGQSVSGQQILVMSGPTSQLTISMQLHFTINANGSVTAFLDSFKSTCLSF